LTAVRNRHACAGDRGDELVSILVRRLDQVGDVAWGETPAMRVVQPIVQDPV
jgi:hypothetical protein